MEYKRSLEETTRSIEEFFRERASAFDRAVDLFCFSLSGGGKILVFGNGGSAAQGQHFAAELVNRFQKNRKALSAIALTTDTSSLTSIANDTRFALIFSRQVEALGREEDVALALSTSGMSANVVAGLKAAKRVGMKSVALTGAGGGRVGGVADILLDVPSRETPRIQEAHLFLLHLLAREIEERLS